MKFLSRTVWPLIPLTWNQFVDEILVAASMDHAVHTANSVIIACMLSDYLDLLSAEAAYVCYRLATCHTDHPFSGMKHLTSNVLCSKIERQLLQRVGYCVPWRTFLTEWSQLVDRELELSGVVEVVCRQRLYHCSSLAIFCGLWWWNEKKKFKEKNFVLK